MTKDKLEQLKLATIKVDKNFLFILGYILNKVFYKSEYVNNRIRSYENIKL